jgi:hypothetical protein
MSTSLMSKDREEAKKKGYWALGASVGTGALVVVGAPIVMSAGAAAGAVYLTYKWFMFRAKRGMRF